MEQREEVRRTTKSVTVLVVGVVGSGKPLLGERGVNVRVAGER